MEQTQKRHKHVGRYILIVLIAVLVFLAVAFFWVKSANPVCAW